MLGTCVLEKVYLGPKENDPPILFHLTIYRAWHFHLYQSLFLHQDSPRGALIWNLIYPSQFSILVITVSLSDGKSNRERNTAEMQSYPIKANQ